MSTSPTTAHAPPDVLVIDDDSSMASTLVQHLTKAGFHPTVAATGLAGFKGARTGRYACILLDLNLPGMDGFAIIRGLHVEAVQTPILVLTNNRDPVAEQRAKEAGVAGFLVKSETPLRAITAALKQMLAA